MERTGVKHVSRVAKRKTVRMKGATDAELIEKYETGQVYLKRLMTVAVKAMKIVKVSVPIKRSKN